MTTEYANQTLTPRQLAINKFLEDIYVNNSAPTTSVKMSRMQIAQPSTLPKEFTEDDSVEWVHHSWGATRIIGRVGQKHTDIMELLFRNCDIRITSDGSAELLVDPYKIRRLAGTHKSLVEINTPVLAPIKKRGRKKQTEQITPMHKRVFFKLMAELQRATIEVYSLKGTVEAMGHILEIEMLQMQIPTKPGCFLSSDSRQESFNNLDLFDDDFEGIFDDRHYYKVTFHKNFMLFISGAHQLYYDPIPIIKLKTGLGKAAVRLILGHNKRKLPNGGWILKNFLISISVKFTGDKDKDAVILNNCRNSLIQDRDGMKEFGVFLEEDRLTYEPEKSTVCLDVRKRVN